MKVASELPREHWPTLGDIALSGPTNGYSGATGPDAAGSPTLKLSATTAGRCVLESATTKRLYETILPDSDLWLEPGDLLVQRSNTRDLVGTAAVYDGPPRAFVYPDLMMRLRFAEPITARFVARYINSSAGRAFMLRMAAGSSGSMPKISGTKLRQMPIPLPSLPQQRRIAGVLDQAEALRAKRRASLAILDTLPQSLFLALFGDPAKRGIWPAKPLRSLTTEFRYGTSRRSAATGKPALRIPNVIGGRVDVSELKLVPVEGPELERLRLRDGDLLFVRTNGNPDFVGRCAVYEAAVAKRAGLPTDDFIFASYLIRARLTKTEIDPVFAREFLLGEEGRRQLRALAKTSAGQFNINTKGLGRLIVPVPSITIQRDFARQIRAIEELKSVHRRSLAELDALFASLQHRAFRGEL